MLEARFKKRKAFVPEVLLDDPDPTMSAHRSFFHGCFGSTLQTLEGEELNRYVASRSVPVASKNVVRGMEPSGEAEALLCS